MWKREEPPKPLQLSTSPTEVDQPQAPPPAPPPPPMREDLGGVGKSIVVNGELSGAEDLTVQGRVEGKIDLRDHVLTVGAHARIKAEVTARMIVVLGRVTGNLSATEKVDIKATGSVDGNIVAPRVVIADGSHFRGTIDMQPKEPPAAADETIGVVKAESLIATPEIQKPEPSSMNGDVVRV